MSEVMENTAVNENEAVNGGTAPEAEPVEQAEESKAEKFIRLGEYRMNKAISAIGRLENLANRSAYDYTPEQAEAMFAALEAEIMRVKAEFTKKEAKGNTVFSFNGRTE